MDGGDSSLKPLPRPRALRQRSHSAITKPSHAPEPAADSDASIKKPSKHRHTQSHHHIPHHPKRFVKDRLLNSNVNSSRSELSKQVSRVSDVPPTSTGTDSRKGSQSQSPFGLDGASQSYPATEDIDRAVLEEQWKNQKRHDELQRTLLGLSEESMKTTRRLDDLYYNLLEKLSGLRSTISNLQELASLTAGLHKQFSEDTTELTQDLGRQIEGFGGFKTQQSDLEDIETRVRMSRQKADGLSERLEKARRRVNRLEEREKEWQASVQARLRWMWTILGTIAGILMAFWLVHIFGNPASALRNFNTDPVKSLTSVPTSVQSILEDVMGVSINSSATGIPSGGASLSSRISEIMADPTSDALVRIFDEL